MFSATTLGSALAALIVLTPVMVGGADNPPPYKSATEAYRQGANAMQSGEIATAVPALEYAAERGVLGAELKLARLYAAGRDVPRNDAKAFYYYRNIANQYAETPSVSPIAKYVGEAFVALGRYYVDGIPTMPLHADPTYAAGLYRHAASYFGDAEAQYQLGRLYLAGTGVEKNQTIAANWLAMAARKQHAAAQAVLGDLLSRGDGIAQRQARGLALLTLAQENAKANGPDSAWIRELYQQAFANADNATRKEAEALMPQLGGPNRTATAAKLAPADDVPPPPTRAAAKPAAAPALSVKEPQLGPVDLVPPAAMGMSVGFGANGDGISGGLQP
ncbi:MAG: tetratricopeptide repeat protein [Hyphomicrobiales bacterium]